MGIRSQSQGHMSASMTHLTKHSNSPLPSLSTKRTVPDGARPLVPKCALECSHTPQVPCASAFVPEVSEGMYCMLCAILSDFGTKHDLEVVGSLLLLDSPL